MRKSALTMVLIFSYEYGIMFPERIFPKGRIKLKDEKTWDAEFPEDEEFPETDEEVEIEVDPDEEESDELYEKYIEIMNQEEEEDEDDIAAVAERITGERHSRVTTAAPLRIRSREEPPTPKETQLPEYLNPPKQEEPELSESLQLPKPQEPEMPEYLELPKRKIEPEEPIQPADEEDEPETTGGIFLRKSLIPAIVAVLVLAVVGVSITVTVNVVQNRREQDELKQEQTQKPNDSPFGTAIENPEETDEESEAETEPPIEETDPPVETEPETEAPPETEPPETEPPLPTYTVTLDFYDRDDITTTVTQMTLAQVYQAVGYTPRESDRPSVSLDYMIAADAYINIDTVSYTSENITVAVPYGSDVIELDTIPRGQVNYLSYGQNGEAVQTYTVEYINGKEVSRTLASEQTTKWPVNESYEIGVGGSFVGADGVTYTYSYRRVVPATYYSLEGLTYLGTQADETVVAVDPDNIPLGTKIYVKNDKYDFGVRIASDVGPKVEEWEVDIWLSPWNPQYDSFAQVGYHYDMEIYYID